MLHKLIFILPLVSMMAWSAAAAGEDFRQLYAHARQKMQSGDYPASIAELNKALAAAQLSSEEVAVLFDLSYACLKMSSLDEAMRYLEQILDIPDLAGNDRNRVYLQMADVHAAAQKYDDAIDDCMEGLGKVTANADKYRFLMKAGHVMNTKKDYPNALDYARQALALCQDNVQNQFMAKRFMIWIYSAQENYPAVIEVFTRQELDAMTVDAKKSFYPSLISAYMKVARNMQADKNYDKSMEIYCLLEKDKGLKPEQRAEACMGEASILKAQKKYSDAIKTYNVVLSIPETKPEHRKIAQKAIEQLQAIIAQPQPGNADKQNGHN
ncbi:MAG: tetratricopeptide repeat protein [Victivallaceae bacterium]